MKIVSGILALLIVWNACLSGISYALYAQNQQLAAAQGMQDVRLDKLNRSLHIEDQNTKTIWRREQKLERVIIKLLEALENLNQDTKPSSLYRN